MTAALVVYWAPTVLCKSNANEIQLNLHISGPWSILLKLRNETLFQTPNWEWAVPPLLQVTHVKIFFTSEYMNKFPHFFFKIFGVSTFSFQICILRLPNDGSCVLKASAVECWLIALIDPQSTLSQHSINTSLTPQLTLGWHSIDILVYTWLTLGWPSTNCWSSVDRLSMHAVPTSVDQDVNQGYQSRVIDWHLTADAFSTHDPKWLVNFAFTNFHYSKISLPDIRFWQIFAGIQIFSEILSNKSQ